MTTKLPAIVLTAGYGTRLLPLTYDRAKPVLPVAGKPLIRRTLSWLAQQGVHNAVLNLHYKPETITSVVGDGTDLGLSVRYSWEPKLLGSAGGPRQALPLLNSNRFLIINGDTLTNMALGDLVDTHERTKAAITLAVMPNTNPERYGGVLVDKDGWVSGFSRVGNPNPSYHFIGVQVVDTTIFLELPDGQPAETIRGIYSSLIKKNKRSLRAHMVSTTFHDIGTPADYLATSLTVAHDEGHYESLVGTRTFIDPTAKLKRTILWDEVTVAKDCVLTDCVIGDRVRLPPGSYFEKLVITVAPESHQIGQREGDLLLVPLSPDEHNTNLDDTTFQS